MLEFVSLQLGMQNVFAVTRGRTRRVSGLQNYVCSWQEGGRAPACAVTLDLLDLNPQAAAGWNVSALGERGERDDKQFGLGHAWKY